MKSSDNNKNNVNALWKQTDHASFLLQHEPPQPDVNSINIFFIFFPFNIWVQNVSQQLIKQ